MKSKLIRIILAVSLCLSSLSAMADNEETETIESSKVEESIAGDDVYSEDDLENIDVIDVANSSNEEYATEQVDTTNSIENENGFFSDVPDSHWAYNSVYELTNRKIIDGVGNGIFNLSGTITREQFVKLIVAANGYGGETDAVLVPPDVKRDTWSYSYIRSAIIRKIVNTETLENGLFRPNENITRADASVWIANSYNGVKAQSECPFPDVTDEAIKASIAICVEKGVIGGYDDEMFKPNRTLTRAEAAVIIARYLGIAQTIAYPNIDKSKYFEAEFQTCDSRNNWPIDGTSVCAFYNNVVSTYDTTDGTGKVKLYLKKGEYTVIFDNKDYNRISIPITIDNKKISQKVSMTPTVESEFINVYPELSQIDKDNFNNMIKAESYIVTVPSEYDYRNGYESVLKSVLNASSLLSSVGYLDVGKEKTDSVLPVKSLGENVDSYLMYFYGLSPNYAVTDSDMSLKYKDNYWFYNQKAVSLPSNIISVEALYTSDYKFYYMKYSVGGSSTTRYAILYKTDFPTYQVVWASTKQMEESALSTYIEEAKKNFPSCVSSHGEYKKLTITTVDSQNNYPLDGVNFSLYTSAGKKVTSGISNSDGKVTLDVPVGSYVVFADHSGYILTRSCVTVKNDNSVATVSVDK